MTHCGKNPKLALEQYVLDELPTESRKTIESVFKKEELHHEVEEIRASNDEILQKYPSHLMATQIRARVEDLSPSRNRPLFRVAVPALTALFAAAIIWVLVPATPPPQIGGNEETILVKGIPELFIFRKSTSGEERVEPNQTVQSGDVLQLKYNARDKATFGMIFSVDGRGTVTLHYPTEMNGSTRLEQGGAHPLPFAYELDDAPRFEHFFLVAGDRPIDVHDIIEKAETEGVNHQSLEALDNINYVHDLKIRKDN